MEPIEPLDPSDLRRAFTEDLADELVRRLPSASIHLRIEIEHDGTRALKVFGHGGWSRSELARFDPVFE
jgi:hypothetical protein